MADRWVRTRNMIVSSDNSVRLYTWLPCKKILRSIFEVIQKRVSKIEYWRGLKSTKINDLKNGACSRIKIIDHFDEYLITLVYIREGMTMKILADWFGISKSSVTCVVTIIMWYVKMEDTCGIVTTWRRSLNQHMDKAAVWGLLGGVCGVIWGVFGGVFGPPRLCNLSHKRRRRRRRRWAVAQQ